MAQTQLIQHMNMVMTNHWLKNNFHMIFLFEPNPVFNSFFVFVQQLQVMPHGFLLAINNQNNNLIPIMTITSVQICFNILIISDGHILILL